MSPSRQLPINKLSTPPVGASSPSTPRPFTAIAVPTAVLERPLIIPGPSGTFDTFHLFPFFPTEIRLKIWKENLPPRTLHITYDINNLFEKRYSYLNGRQYRAEWRFESNITLTNRIICQESRAEFEKSGYELVRLRNNATQGRWFNFDTDKMFWDTNARAPVGSYDDDYYQPNLDIDNVLPPTGLPVLSRGLEKLKLLAVSDALWTDWPFAADNGTDVSCEGCSGYHEDETKDEFKEAIGKKLKGLEKLQIVRAGDRQLDAGSAWRFEQSSDPYARSLMARVHAWLEASEMGHVKVEIVQ